MLLNNYTPDSQFTTFTDLDQRLSDYYDVVVTDIDIPKSTPRYRYESGLKIGFRDIFWYIDQLYSAQPADVVDIGCGENVFKKWFPNLTGVDSDEYPYGGPDIVAFFDTDYAKSNQERWDSGMALGALHYCHWRDLEQQIENAMTVVKKNFLFTLNFDQMMALPTTDLDRLVERMYSIITSLNYSLVMFDSPRLRGHNWQGRGYFNCNGSVRFILEK